MKSFRTIDLRNIYPRSPQETLGGYVHLPRMIDKARAKLAGTLGEYIWNCPLDQHLLQFLKLDADDLFAIIKKSACDADVLTQIRSRTCHAPAQIKKWSDGMRRRAPQSAKDKEWFAKRNAELGRPKGELLTYFDLLDADEKRK